MAKQNNKRSGGSHSDKAREKERGEREERRRKEEQRRHEQKEKAVWCAVAAMSSCLSHTHFPLRYKHADTVAASLGKLVRPRERAAAKPEDLARGILDAITNNVVRAGLDRTDL